jgi:hypothetical protein
MKAYVLRLGLRFRDDTHARSELGHALAIGFTGAVIVFVVISVPGLDRYFDMATGGFEEIIGRFGL